MTTKDASAQALKKVPMAQVEVDELDRELTWKFANGKQVSIRVGDLSPAIIAKAVLHGLKQTISDSYSAAKGNADHAQAFAEGRIQSLLSGDWAARASAGQGLLDLIEAITTVSGRDRALVEEKVNSLDADGRKALEKNPAIKAELAKIKAARLVKVAGAVETDDGLDALFGGV
jgi:hypothetical protein